jgi:hypothetical protein
MGKVNLTKRVTENGIQKFYPVEIKQGQITNKKTLPIEGTFYLDWTEGGKRKRVMIGADSEAALAAKDQKEAALNAVRHGIAVIPSVVGNGKRATLAKAAETWLEEIRLTKKPKTYAAYRVAMAYFQESCLHVYLDEITRNDLLKFSAFLRKEKEQSPRSCANKFEVVISFLKAQKITGLIRKNDWPRYTEEEPEVYAEQTWTSSLRLAMTRRGFGLSSS